MITASVSEIRRALKDLSHAEIMKICLRLASFKTENKGLISYLIFEAGNEAGYREAVKEEIEEAFLQVNRYSVYQAKKSIRKILKTANNYIRYSGQPQTKVEILIFFCQQLRALPLDFSGSRVLQNLYYRQLDNIEKTMAKLNEDLQFDYQQEVSSLRSKRDIY